MRLTNSVLPYLREIGIEGNEIPDDKIWFACVGLLYSSTYPLKTSCVAGILCDVLEIPWTFWHQHIERCLKARKDLNNEEAMYNFAKEYGEFVDSVLETATKFGAILQEF